MQTEDLGALLKSQRQEKNFTIEQVSKAISIRPFIIEALESGQYDSIDAPLYTRNYLKQYAEFLGFHADEVEVMVKVIPNHEVNYQHLKRSTEIKNIENRRKKRFIMKLYFFAVLLVIVGVYLYFTVERHGDFFESKLPANNNSSRLHSPILDEEHIETKEEAGITLPLEAPSLFGEEAIEEIDTMVEAETMEGVEATEGLEKASDNEASKETLGNDDNGDGDREEAMLSLEEPNSTSKLEALTGTNTTSGEAMSRTNLTTHQEGNEEGVEILGNSLTEEVARIQSIARQGRTLNANRPANNTPLNEGIDIVAGEEGSLSASLDEKNGEDEKNILYIAVDNGENWVGILRNNSAIKQGVVSPNNPLRLEVEESFLSGEEGESFLQIRFGNAPSVSELRFNGKTIAPHLYTPESGRSVITFRLDVAEYQ